MPNPTGVRLRVAVIAGQPAFPVAGWPIWPTWRAGSTTARVPITGTDADLSLNVVRDRPTSGSAWPGTRTSQGGIGQLQATLSDTAGVVAGGRWSAWGPERHAGTAR